MNKITPAIARFVLLRCRRRALRLSLNLLAGMSLLTAACEPRPSATDALTAPRLADHGLPARHAVHHEELRRLMQQLFRAEFEELPQELNTPAEQTRRTRRLAIAAGHVADAAVHIPDVMPRLELTPDERRLFADLAATLAAQAGQMRAAAERGRVDEVRTINAQLVTTCNACHTNFRLPRPRT